MLSSILSNPMDLIYRLPAIFVALAFHEWGHAYSAYKLGDPTARNLGRMTVDPFKHIDIMGFLMLVLVGFGWAKPVPINPSKFKHPRKDEIIVSLAGVGVNIVLAFVFFGIYNALMIFNPNTNEVLLNILANFFKINIGLFVFNLLPIPPLDGYHVFKNLLIRKINLKFFWTIERYGFYILIGLLVIPGLLNLPGLGDLLSLLVKGIYIGFSAIYYGIFNLFI